jgi:hypothetical protein
MTHKPRPSHPPKRIIWDTWGDLSYQGDLPRFEKFARRAARHGATHVCVSRLPFARGRLKDPRDPRPEWVSWPVWSMINTGLLHVVPLPELARWLPQDEARANLALLRKRGAILRKLGLRATFEANDPMWLPEGVYEAHPEWRGAQAELLRIAHLPFFSPNIDHPEVLALYRKAMAAVCRAVPEVEIFSSFTNDSSGALPWSASCYPGPNGPSESRERPMGDRVVGFLSALQEGARDAGREIEVQLGTLGRATPIESYSALKPGQFYNWTGREGREWASGIEGGNGWGIGTFYPVVGVARVLNFAAEASAALGAGAHRWGVSFGPEMEDLLIEVYAAIMARKAGGPAERAAALLEVAGRRVGAKRAPELYAAWEDVEKAAECVRNIRTMGYSSLFLVGPLMMRWLTMPLVPDLGAVPAREKAGFARHRVAKDANEADSYDALLGVPGVVGAAAVWMAGFSLWDAGQHVLRAKGRVAALLEAAVDRRARAELDLFGKRLAALECVLATCRHFIQYAHLLRTRGRMESEITMRHPNGFSYDVNRAGFELRGLARAEADNAIALAKLVESASGPVIMTAKRREEEDAFVFGPDLAAQLRRKVKMMFARWPDYDRLYPALPLVEPLPPRAPAAGP